MSGFLRGAVAGETESYRIEEVLYLHSLWRRGPPPERTRNPNADPVPPQSTVLTKKRTRNNKRKKMQQSNEEADYIPESVEWPKIVIKPPATTWEEVSAAIPTPQPRKLTTDDVSVLVQRGAAVQCEKLFTSKKNEIDSNNDDDEEVISEEDAFLFFLDFFRKEEELRLHYERNWEKGGFFCMVCLGDHAKLHRRYPGCVSLVHHASTIRMERIRGAHRAYGKVICRVLGWDFSRLPSIVLDLAGPLFPPKTVLPDSKAVSPVDNSILEDAGSAEKNEVCEQ